MKKMILSLFLVVLTVFSADKVSVPFTAESGGTMDYDDYNSNNDTLAEYLNKVVDTMNLNVPRYTQNAYTHDLIMPFLRVDSLRSNPDVDSIRIHQLTADTANIDKLYIDSLTVGGSPYVIAAQTGSIYLKSGNDTAGSCSGYQTEIGDKCMVSLAVNGVIHPDSIPYLVLFDYSTGLTFGRERVPIVLYNDSAYTGGSIVISNDTARIYCDQGTPTGFLMIEGTLVYKCK